MTEEEKLLLEVIASDSTTITTTLKKLLHCGKKEISQHTMQTIYKCEVHFICENNSSLLSLRIVSLVFLLFLLLIFPHTGSFTEFYKLKI